MPIPASNCSRCSKRLGPNPIRAAGQQFHPACFICDSCKQPLESRFMTRSNRLYHSECHDRLFVPRCHHCGEAIQGTYSRDGVGRYHSECYTQLHQLFCTICSQAIRGRYAIDHWGNKAHAEHDGVPTGLCHVCARLMPADGATGGRALSDGRLVCGGCHASEIQEFRGIHQAKLDVIAQMLAVGFAYIPDYIKVELSEDQQLLNERLRASPTGNIHGFTRTARRLIPGYGEILEHSISVLSGLPRVAFMGVLAHELLHVWIHEQGHRHLSHAQVEGFCNLGTALMLNNALGGPDAALAKVLLQRMDEDPDPAYGDGYRAMAWRLEQLGWPGLIAALGQREVPLAEPAAELIRPRVPQPEAPAPRPSAPAAPAPSPATSAATERLQALKQKLQATMPARPTSPAGSNQTPSPVNQAPSRPANLPVNRPEVSSEIADKVREKFAKPVPRPPENKPGKSGGAQQGGSGKGKLGKLKKPGK